MRIIWHSLLSPNLYRVLFAIFLIITIFLMFNRPSQIQMATMINDKMAHAITFFILTLLFSRGLPGWYGIGAITGLAFFGLFIEVIQYLIPWRSFSIADWLADVAGIISYHILHGIRSRYVEVSGRLDDV